MRIGVLSDIHGNLAALKACIKRLKDEGAETFIQCGDIIGYGPDAEACVRQILRLPLCASVMGNHDAVLAFPAIENLFNFDAKMAIEKNLPELSRTSIDYLCTLPPLAQGNNFTVVHGTPLDPIKEYFHNTVQFAAYYGLWQGQILFVGHTHLPFYIRGSARSGRMYFGPKEEYTLHLNDKYRYVINPGAVGKPRDHNPGAACGLWDTEKNTFTFMRVWYDVVATQASMREKDFPEFLIESLSYGL